MKIILGIMIPFIGTILGASIVFFMKKCISDNISRFLFGFAAGVMIAASIWSLLIPSIEMTTGIKWIPAASGFIIGMLFLMFIKRYSINVNNYDLKKTMMLIWAVTLHNIPEGMAIGVVFAGVILNDSIVSMALAMSLAIGIAIQNIPEGAIISMPLKEQGFSKEKSFLYGVLSGIVEPIGAGITIFITGFVSSFLPYFLSFAAGAMMYVVVVELIPDAQNKDYHNYGIIGVMLGFVLMMVLDVMFK